MSSLARPLSGARGNAVDAALAAALVRIDRTEAALRILRDAIYVAADAMVPHPKVADLMMALHLTERVES